MGPFPKAKAGKKFVVVAMDYFTKWAEAEALSKIDQTEIKNLIWKNLVFKYGVYHILITNNGTQFKKGVFQQFCADLNIRHHFSSSRYPQANGKLR